MEFITYEQLGQEILSRWGHKVDKGRVARAVRIAANVNSIFDSKCSKGCADVRSDKGTGFYRVNTVKHTCTCTDSRRGNLCKHRMAVWMRAELVKRNEARAKASGAQQFKRGKHAPVYS